MTTPAPRCPETGKASYPTAADADQAATRHGATHTYLCRHGCGNWHLTTQPYVPLGLDKRRRHQHRRPTTSRHRNG